MATKPSKKSTASVPTTAAAAAPAARSAQLPSDRVATRAYEIWLECGCPHGQHEEHWYRAERELRTGAAR